MVYCRKAQKILYNHEENIYSTFMESLKWDLQNQSYSPNTIGEQANTGSTKNTKTDLRHPCNS